MFFVPDTFESTLITTLILLKELDTTERLHFPITEHLLCARPCSRHRGCGTDKQRSSLRELAFYWADSQTVQLISKQTHAVSDSYTQALKEKQGQVTVCVGLARESFLGGERAESPRKWWTKPAELQVSTLSLADSESVGLGVLPFSLCSLHHFLSRSWSLGLSPSPSLLFPYSVTKALCLSLGVFVASFSLPLWKGSHCLAESLAGPL